MNIPNDGKMEAFMLDAVKEVIRVENFHIFLQWMQDHIGGISPLSINPRQDRHLRSTATNMALAIWNATPLPGNNFKPDPRPVPKRNAPCVCGSGKKYKKCCFISSIDIPELNADAIYPMLFQVMPMSTLKKAIQQGLLPITARIPYCEELLDTGKYNKITDILQPYYLEKTFPKRDEIVGLGMSLLCDAYDGLMQFEKKIHLLEHLIKHAPSSPLRSDALQRRASIYADEGELDKAFVCFKKAKKDTPKDRAVGLLEIQLLLMSDKCALASSRARFLRKQVEREMREFFTEDEAPLLDFLDMVVNAPEEAQALLQPGKTGDDDKIAVWLDRNCGRPAVVHRLTKLKDLTPDTRETPGFGRPHFTIDTPKKLIDINAQWIDICPIMPLFGARMHPMAPEFPWEEDCEIWQDFILTNPKVLDSIVIVDDLLTIMSLHPFAHDPLFKERMQAPLINRGLMLVKATLKKLPENGCLPWVVLENRPLLRLLIRKIEHDANLGKPEDITAMMEQLIDLNPQDNHGLREELVNMHLYNGENTQALALCEQYSDDVLPAIIYGKVLALYRLNKKTEALQAAKKAKKTLPHIASYICPAKRSEPRGRFLEGVAGSKEEAWDYRQEMREVWKSTRGALAMLKKA